MIKQLVSGMAKRLGYTIVPTWQINDFHTVRHLACVFEWLDIDLVIDVGANAGQYRDMLRDRVGYTGRIVSFEPVPHLARALAQRSAGDANWTVENRALGAAAGTAEFNVMAETQFSSFYAPRHDDVGLFRNSNKVRERIPVEVSTLDAVLPPLLDNHASRRVYLKIDTQGFELEVFKGGVESLPRIAALQIEASVRPIYDGTPAYQDVIGFASEHGFVMSGMFPNQDHFPLLIEFDCLMIQRALVSSRASGASAPAGFQADRVGRTVDAVLKDSPGTFGSSRG
jgi:FkbM family methyltransferase